MSGDAKTNLSNEKSTAIPTRIVEIKDASQMPTDFSTTPGGTLFSTTPGGYACILFAYFTINCTSILLPCS